MLRTVLLALGTLSLIGSVIAAWLGIYPATFWLLINGLAMTAGIVWERWRYRAVDTHTPGAGWQRTDERFIDPESGKLTEVWFEPATGERRYVLSDRLQESNRRQARNT